MNRETFKNGKMGQRIAVINTKNGLRIASTDINKGNGKELYFSYVTTNTVQRKIKEFSKTYNLPIYNHAKDN